MPRMLALMLLAAATTLSARAAEPAPDKPLYGEGRILVVVAPRYPKEALAKGLTGKVDVFGTVRTDGRLENMRIEANPPGDAFESAVMEVAPLWRLQPRIASPGCDAFDTQGHVTIWFDIDGAKPKVSYGASPPAGAVPPVIHSDRNPVHMVTPVYPRKLAADPRAPKSALQVAYVSVYPDGAVTGVTVAPMIYYLDFEAVLVNAIRKWKFAPQDEPWCGEFRFQMSLE